ncbi:MAG: MiaB/RimO family radical SAM methylthiotransferase [Candidatus Omnitrophica bacterium]|nr:MiaB/RimO family radical SAM methylthiotransferase [Candidatus Omnitrophota bacterium]
MKFYLKTLGCKVNQYESQVIRERLLRQGYEETLDMSAAQLCFVNTCTVTAKADRECREVLRRISKANSKARIIAAGCYAVSGYDAIKAIDGRIEVLDNAGKMELFYLNGEPDGISMFHDRTRAFIKVQDGCDNFCSYCRIPYVRGRSRSRNAESILEEAAGLVGKGYREIVLTGICLGDFSRQGGSCGLACLIRRISGIDGDFRVRLSSIELADINDDILNEISLSKKICHHLHIPLQSGDDEILKKMNRRYTAGQFISRVASIRSRIPDIGITTDIIVGFPGEKEANFKNSIITMQAIKPSRTHVFTFSPRQGTKAFDMGQDISGREKKERACVLKKAAEHFSREFNAGLCRKEQRILVEGRRDRATGMLCGYTDNYARVLIDGNDDLMGHLVWRRCEDWSY